MCVRECVGKPVKYLSFQQTAHVLATIRISGALRVQQYVCVGVLALDCGADCTCFTLH